MKRPRGRVVDRDGVILAQCERLDVETDGGIGVGYCTTHAGNRTSYCWRPLLHHSIEVLFVVWYSLTAERHACCQIRRSKTARP